MNGGLLAELAVVAAVAVLLAGMLAARRRAARRRAVRELVSQMLPEIRAILADSEAHAADTASYAMSRHRLPRILPRETLFAVQTFYQSAEALARATGAMSTAFAEGSDASLGDRIRAKDRRDRLMKDVYDSGEAAIEKLESIP